MFDELIPQIPIHEAASFFHRVKYAGWSDPPDLTGQLEGQFNTPPEQVVALLTKVITAKFQMVVAYYTFAESMRDIAQHGVGEMFHTHALQELGAAEYYLKRSAVLGGAIHLDEIEPPPASTEPVHIIQTMMRAEQEAIALQRQLRDMVGDQNPMKIEVEEKLAQDQHHLDELWQMLPPELHEQAQAEMAAAAPPPMEEPAPDTAPSGAPPTEAPPAAEGGESKAPPAKEAAMRMRFSLALQKTAEKAPATDADLKETGRQRAVTQLSAEAHREKGRHGERVGETLGRAGGALAGAAAGRKLIGGRLGTVAGLAAGMGVGGKAGKELGAERDIHKNASLRHHVDAVMAPIARDFQSVTFHVDPTGDLTHVDLDLRKTAAAMRFKLATMKLGFGETPPIHEYLAAEQQGQEAQGLAEADFYREKLRAATESGNASQQQLSDLQMQLQQAQEQQAQVGATIQAANQEAVSARDDALQQTQISANMRIGYQKLRQQIIDMASQDPESMVMPGEVPQGAGAGMVPGMAPNGDPAMAPTGAPAEGMAAGQPGAAPGAAPPGQPAGEAGAPGSPGATANASGESGATVDDTSAATSQKVGGLMDHAGALAGGAAGAVLGARHELSQAKGMPERASELDNATQTNDGSFNAALAIAKARAGVQQAEFAGEHPVQAAIKGGLKGGMLGAAGGAAAQGIGGSLAELFH